MEDVGEIAVLMKKLTTYFEIIYFVLLFLGKDSFSLLFIGAKLLTID